MATDQGYIEYFLEGLEGADVRVRPMMGEYVVYCKDKVVGDVCDNKLFVKITPVSRSILGNAPELPPYEGAKPYFFVEDTDDKEFLRKLFSEVADGLPASKKKRG